MNINGALFLFLTNMTFQNVFAVINVRDIPLIPFIQMPHLLFLELKFEGIYIPTTKIYPVPSYNPSYYKNDLGFLR